MLNAPIQRDVAIPRIVTHDQERALTLSDRVGILVMGRLILGRHRHGNSPISRRANRRDFSRRCEHLNGTTGDGGHEHRLTAAF